MTAVRRSGRARKQVESVYDDAAKALHEEEKRRMEEIEEEEMEEEEKEEEEEDEYDDDDEDKKEDEMEESTDEDKDQQDDKGEEVDDETEEESPREEAEDGGNGDGDGDGDVAVADNDSEGDESSEDEDFEKPLPGKKGKAAAAKAKATRKRKSPSSSSPPPPKTKKAGKGKKIQVQIGPGGKLTRRPAPASKAATRGKAASAGGGGGGGAARRAINAALASLAKKTLEHYELPTNSLVAGLLFSYRPAEPSHPKGGGGEGGGGILGRQAVVSPPFSPSFPQTPYTSQLSSLASSVVTLHNSDPNAAQIQLLNLLFRSVGGTNDSNLDPDDVRLDEMDPDDWSRVVTDLVDEMRHTPADRILLCADPDGAVHASAVLEKGRGGGDGGGAEKTLVAAAAVPAHSSSLGVREYRKIYEEFWYVLGGAALAEGNMASNAAQAEMEEDVEDSSDDDDEGEEQDDEDDDDGDDDEGGDGRSGKRKRKSMTPKKTSKKKTKKTPKKKAKATFTTTIRFDAELVKELISRVIELVSVGQPDVRAAATIAAYQMGLAVLDKTVLLGSKLELAKRQYAAAAKRDGGSNSPGPGAGGGGRKAESLKHQLDSLRRTREDLEEVVLGPVIQGVFIHRYRDSNMHIRTASIETLSVMTIRRPDLFLQDKYLKYFGWMMSDKSELVRAASLAGLAAPFDVVHGTAVGGCVGVGGGGARGGRVLADAAAADRIDLKAMANVSAKFLPRLADCVIDVSTRVQEEAMRLLLALLRDGFLDEVEDEAIWNQINLRALAPDTSPATRRDALYFVMEQLEAFDDADDDNDDDGGGEDGPAAPPPLKKSKSAAGAASAAESSERRTVQRLDALASWTAHALTDGPVPIDRIRVDLADFVVLALRDMPDHRHIVRDWSALTRAISDDRAATTTQGTTAGDRADVAKQRVLVRMLACAARAEVGDVTDSSFLLGDIDPDVVAHQSTAAGGGDGAPPGRVHKKGGPGHHAASTAIQHESLSVALLKALPELLIKFKGDSAILCSLTSLPRYLLPTVFSLPQRKSDFTSLAKNLAEIFLSSTDDKVLQNAALSLFYLTEGDHARGPDAHLQMKEVTQELQGRLVDLFSEDISALFSKNAVASHRKRPRGGETPLSGRASSSSSSSSSSTHDGDYENVHESEAPSEAEDHEYSLFLNLKRFRVLSKRCDVSPFLGEGEGSDASSHGDTSLEALCSVIADGLNARLKAWKVVNRGTSEGDDGSETPPPPPSPWDCGYKNVAKIVACSISEGLTVLLALTAWKLLSVQKEESLIIQDEDVEEDEEGSPSESEDVDDHLIVRMRDRMIALVINCYDQFLDESGERRLLPEQIAFADVVQSSAGQITSDLRTLFPKEWANAASPLLRAFAMQDDGRLLSGYVRYLRSKEALLKSFEGRESDDRDEEKGAVTRLLLPIGRALATNWTLGNRREAGIILAHLTGSGKESHDLVAALSRIFKKVEPVRLLEAQMASLRSGYEAWLESEPAEIESERPTDEEMAAYEEDERRHSDQFSQLETLAVKFSQSLGTGKLGSDKLSPALLGFMREGIKAAFYFDEEWALGSRLSFLNILGKYSIWLKKNKSHLRIVEQDLDEREMALRSHEEFPEVHVDDLACLEEFRGSLGLKLSSVAQALAADQESNIVEEEMSDGVSELQTPATRRSTASRLSTVSRYSTASRYSMASRYSTASRYSRSSANDGTSEAYTPATQRSSTSLLTRTPMSDSVSEMLTPATRRSTASQFSRASTVKSSVRSDLSPLYEDRSPSPGAVPGSSPERSSLERSLTERSSLERSSPERSSTEPSPSPAAHMKATQATVDGEVSDIGHDGLEGSEEEESRYSGMELK